MAVDPTDEAILTGGPWPENANAFRAHLSRIENPWQPGLIPHVIEPLATVFEQYHGRPMTEADAAEILEREQRRAPKTPEARLAMLEQQHESARIDALSVSHRVGISDAEKAEAEQRRANAEAERDRLAGEIAELRTRLGVTPTASNWPDAETEGFTPVARLEQDDDE